MILHNKISENMQNQLYFDNTVDIRILQQFSSSRNRTMRQTGLGTRQNVLNNLYNQDIAPEDSEITSFYYHKTLALQCLIAAFSLCSVVLTLVSYVYRNELSQEVIKRTYNLLLVFTVLGVVGIILKKISQIKWIKQKKQKNLQIKKQIALLFLEVIFYSPFPMTYTDKTFEIPTYGNHMGELNYNSFISFYLLFNRFIYIIIFLIHSELFYGSQPDRLSRLYTVKFGTFNAIKFLINEKPGAVIKTTFSFNFLVLPFAMLLIQGQINKYLNTFHSCLYFVVVTQATVGYGDIVPASIFGRVVTLMIIMAGVTNTSLLLILFMRLMQLRGQQEQSLYLLQSLEKKVNLTRARVYRIQSEWVYSNMRCTPQERAKKQQQIKALRYNNRRSVMLDRAGPINVKRMMLSNFSQIMQNLNVIRQKNNIIVKCIDVIKSSDMNNKKQGHLKQSFYKTKNQRQEIAKQFNKTKNKDKDKIRSGFSKEKENLDPMKQKKNANQLFLQLVNSEQKLQTEQKKLLNKKNSKKTSTKKSYISGFLYDLQQK